MNEKLQEEIMKLLRDLALSQPLTYYSEEDEIGCCALCGENEMYPCKLDCVYERAKQLLEKMEKP